MNSTTRYISRLFHSIHLHGEKAAQKFNKEELHKMRVALKKVVAAFHLTSFLMPSRLQKEDLHKLRKIFKAAGKVREIQLMWSRLKDIPSGDESVDDALKEYFKEEEKSAKKKFRHAYNSSDKDIDELREKITESLQQAGRMSRAPYFEQHVHMISKTIASRDLNEKGLHELRKHLKELKYNLKMATRRIIRQVENALPVTWMNECEDVIGKWHDEVMFIVFFKKKTDEIGNNRKLKQYIKNQMDISQKLCHDHWLKLQQMFSEYIKKEIRS